ncbi:methyltransferase domain-containing protein [Aromatoleum aromaticum]|uniref:methyltransferase domain-containing protein n=1 Tax=Aromatoleum aromaticum TaxID=551760 RepID=UPI001459CF5A|nr:methyltransferase domain-containing protein [Aromatoleum aromaticum]NMG53107.1 methyltransferase domain-containing protein [Aromatoleum aromaticum]
MSALPDFALARELLVRRFGRAAATYDEVAVLAREVARRMDERLDYIRIEPKRILDLGCGTGADFGALGKRYPKAMRIGADFALPMLDRARGERSLFVRLRSLGRSAPPSLVCADASALPFARASLSLVWSNLLLNWLADPLPALREMHRVLETDGLLMFSSLGPDTLKELRAALPDTHGTRVHRFIDMHDLGDALVAAGFSDPVMDMEVLTLTYANLDELLRDLRLSGSANASRARPRGLAGKSGWATARNALEALRRDGRLPATFEIVQGHAWKAQPKTTDDGRAIVQFQPRKVRG